MRVVRDLLVVLMAAKRPGDLLVCHVRAHRRWEKQILRLADARCRMTANYYL